VNKVVLKFIIKNMGIPKFFKWLSKRYPLLLKDVKKDSDIPPFGIHSLNIH
jgi:5'-3' exonuclease